MILVWKNNGVFKKHLEDMESFRRTHHHFMPTPQITKDKATQILPHTPSCHLEAINHLKDDKGNSIVVPIWELSLPKGAQN